MQNQITRPDGRIDRRSLLGLAGGLAMGTGLGAAGLARAADPFKIGWVRPTTGRFASSFAPLYVPGLMAIDEINAAGGILGRAIERIEVDDEAAPAKQPGVMKKIQGDGVQYVVGPTGDAQCLASLPTSTAANTVQACFTNGTKPMDGVTFPYSYVLFHSVQMIADLCIDHFHAKGARKFGVLVENTSAGEAAIAACKPSLARYQLEPTTVQVFPLNSGTVGPYIANLRKAGTEVIVSFIGSTPPAALVLNAMAEQQWFPPITGHAGLMYEALFDLVPKEALQNASAVIFKGLSWTASEPPGKRQQDFAKKMLTYPDVNAPYNVASGPFYDFIYLLKSVIEQEKTFDTRKVKAALDRVKGFQGVRCKLSFTPDNHCGVTSDEIVLASVMSAKDPRSGNSVFRERLV
ncbi:ABC transporter substrate-binding protein [Variovorax sp. PBL-E5]|uniref:ABC transporter substrate-binding protein n=1 Tax=Variovorax sp. PBL-E5 TaxID=434014 RepID=UPI001317EFAA|nr:ABC transporter substrate-binding protein [Variovorax sp. PBL-E5]VTU40001.1 Leucine-, isoleucine-, valine-, threonine-, and alanine-binding protein precursor [Variovorax sp. PBL-E5]